MGPSPTPDLMDPLGLFDSEEWRAVVGSDGWYEVSSLGRVRSWVISNGRGSGRRRAVPRLLRQGATGQKKNYRNVLVLRHGKPRSVAIHILVLEAFVGPHPDGTEACHANDIGSDNRLENLRWDTPVANWSDRKINGNGVDGEQNPAAKINKQIADRVRAHRANGLTQKEAGDREGISQTQVWRITTGKVWV